MEIFRFAKKCVKKVIIFMWKVLRKLHIISDYKFRGLMLRFTDEYKFLTISPYFDKKWYVKRYKDVAIDPVQHYMKFGFKEGKNPSLYFNGKKYLEALEGIRELTVNPLLDMEMCGLRERRPCPSVVNFWGCYEAQNGRKYLIMSSVLPEIHFFCGDDEMECTEGIEDSAVFFFDTYIKKEFSENVFYYDITKLNFKYGMQFRVEIDIKIPVYILTLFAWTTFSYNKFLDTKKQFLAVKDNTITVTDYNGFVNNVHATCNEEQVRRFNQFSKIKEEDKSITLFAEFRNIANDNTWQVFNEALKHDKNCYFITGAVRYENETNEEVKKHMVVYNSEEHIQAFMHCKKIFCSWTLSDVVPTVFKHEFFPYPFMTDNWYYCPHGISYDKNSYFLTPIFLTQPKKLCCSSENEKKYFDEKCGLKNVVVTGYPRMDKWDEAANEDILFNFTYRKQYTDEYFDIIAKTVQEVRKAYPDRGIFYLFHPAITNKYQNRIMELIDDESIQYAHASDQESFNKWFNECKYLVTDYSSVAYDFAYKKNSVSIYYMEEGFTENHYELYDEFYEKHCGIIVDNKEQLIDVLRKDADMSDVTRRKESFFNYLDKNNTRRVYEEVF